MGQLQNLTVRDVGKLIIQVIVIIMIIIVICMIIVVINIITLIIIVIFCRGTSMRAGEGREMLGPTYLMSTLPILIT